MGFEYVVPNDSSTFSQLENQKNEMFQQGLFEDAEAEGGRLVKEADFEAENFFFQFKKKFSFPTLLLCVHAVFPL